MPTASYPVAWYGHIASISAKEPYDDKVVLSYGAGEFGIKGNTPELEETIRSLRDATGEAEYVHLWGVLYCGIDDYNTCQLNVDRLEYGDQYSIALYDIGDWVGTIKSTTFFGETVYVFELSGQLPVWYGISGANDPLIQGEIEALSDTNTIVTIWGDLLVGVDGVSGTRIEVRMVDPPGPNMMPSPTSCDSESGYLGSVEEMVEFIQTNLETGNHRPFSYAIGNPFVIGYWQSEGVVLPRKEAYQQLTTNFLPSPDDVVVITDPASFPDLGGRSLETIWGPDVDVAATIYSKGWGSDGQQEAILSVARCDSHGIDVYYWYGMMYGRFE